MTLNFSREVIILNGLPVLGAVTVEVHAEWDASYYAWALDLEPTAFEPETPGLGLLWPAVEAPCNDWLKDNKRRVETEAFKQYYA